MFNSTSAPVVTSTKQAYSKPCPVCGRLIIEDYPSSLKDRRYCSSECFGIARRTFNATHQRCAKCDTWKPLDEFRANRRRASGRGASCKICRRGEKQPDPCLRYGMDPAEYARVLNEQGGVCAICGQPEMRRRLCIDHDHDSGFIRGLLCSGCNTAIGLMKDDPERLAKAAAYLKERHA